MKTRPWQRTIGADSSEAFHAEAVNDELNELLDLVGHLFLRRDPKTARIVLCVYLYIYTNIYVHTIYIKHIYI